LDGRKTVRRKRGKRPQNGGRYKWITTEETLAMLHVGSTFFHDEVKKHLQVKQPGRRLLVNEYSVHRYIRNLPDANR
jgi:hypothetical protein